MTITDPAGLADEPDITAPAGTIGAAAEILALAAELIDTSPGNGIQAQIAAFLDRKGAEPEPAAAWMITSIRVLAAELNAVLAAEGIACDRRLARYWRRPVLPR